MLSCLTGELARQRIADLHAEADRWRLAGRVRTAPWIQILHHPTAFRRGTDRARRHSTARLPVP